MSTSQTIRVVVFKEDDKWIAQCLEHDICTVADDLDTLQCRLDVAIEAEIDLCRSEGRDLSSLPAAPEHFFSLWEKRPGQSDGIDYEMALCA
jgi:hypothetical protein